MLSSDLLQPSAFIIGMMRKKDPRSGQMLPTMLDASSGRTPSRGYFSLYGTTAPRPATSGKMHLFLFQFTFLLSPLDNPIMIGV